MGMQHATQHTRLASLAKIREEIVPLYLDPAPDADTLRDWFDAAKIPRFKSNPTAKRGGGTVYYSVPHVEKFFRNRVLVPA
jgi:hypothetical protein